MRRRFLRSLIGLLFACTLAAVPNITRAQEPVVYGIFFYSPTCPHCHEVIANHWPGIQAEFGDQLRVLFVDVTTVTGHSMMVDTIAALHIDATGVPMLIIGPQMLLGSADIPLHAPDMIRAGLAAGGVDLPAVDSVRQAYQTAIEQSGIEDQAAEIDAAASPSFADNRSLGERLAADPIANTLALLMLVLLVSSLIVIAVAEWQNRVGHNKRRLMAVSKWGQRVILLLALIGIGMSLSLAAGWNGDVGVLLLAVGVLIVFATAAIVDRSRWRSQLSSGWLIPLVALAGIAVAGYMTYVEITLAEATCGTVGNCNLVQQSPYARVFNIPVGIFGLIGYISIALVYMLGRANIWRRWMDRILKLLLVSGVVFSVYLTFLEPFVIGASCLWCLTSALVMLMLLWLYVGQDQEAFTRSPESGGVIRLAA